ncbi:carboxylesterase family protein [Nocardia niigatensis]
MEIAVEGGRIRGRLETDVVAWQAIPYAAPPVGELRLRAPRPVRSWRRVRDATRFRDALLSHPLSSPLGTFRRQAQKSPTKCAVCPGVPLHPVRSRSQSQQQPDSTNLQSVTSPPFTSRPSTNGYETSEGGKLPATHHFQNTAYVY